ncbi:MAG: hypothetical protein C0514_03515 [Candidatus Puniceispirillum sp.]|nr:hypothetical protein [Candidatus Puniceispirillum sp.]
MPSLHLCLSFFLSLLVTCPNATASDDQESEPFQARVRITVPLSDGVPQLSQEAPLVELLKAQMERVQSLSMVIHVNGKPAHLYAKRLTPVKTSKMLAQPTLVRVTHESVPHYLFEHQSRRFFFTLRPLSH